MWSNILRRITNSLDPDRAVPSGRGPDFPDVLVSHTDMPDHQNLISRITSFHRKTPVQDLLQYNIDVWNPYAPFCLDGEMMSIFRNVKQFARVERFHLEACGSELDRDSYIVFDLPLHMLPSVKHITLESGQCLRIINMNDGRGDKFGEGEGEGEGGGDDDDDAGGDEENGESDNDEREGTEDNEGEGDINYEGIGGNEGPGQGYFDEGIGENLNEGEGYFNYEGSVDNGGEEGSVHDEGEEYFNDEGYWEGGGDDYNDGEEDEGDNEDNEEEDDNRLPPRVPGNTVPALETITIETPKPTVLSHWVSDVLQKQKERGEWDMFHKLLVVKRDEDNRQRKEKVTETYVRNAALTWCKS